MHVVRKHPDPGRFTLKTLAALIEAHLREYPSRVVVVYVDFCCLYQVNAEGKRTDEQHDLFIKGLMSSNLLYGHQFTHVWCLTRLPPQPPGGQTLVPYHSSGWCHLEFCLAAALKNKSYFLDIGTLPDKILEDLNKTDNEGKFLHSFYKDVESVCSCERKPTPNLEQFKEELGTKVFTNQKDDSKRVAKIFSTFLDEGIGLAEAWSFSGLVWGDKEVKQLSALLPLCSELRTLDLSRTQITDVGLQSLSKSLPVTLTELNLGDVHITDLGAAALAAAKLPKLCRLNLQRAFKGSAGCPQNQMRSVEAVRSFRRFYKVDTAACAGDAKKHERDPTVNGSRNERIHHSIRCGGGHEDSHVGRDCNGIWQLCPDEPLYEGAPHYVHDDHSQNGTHHLYLDRDLTSGVRTWVIGSWPGSADFLARSDVCDAEEQYCPTRLRCQMHWEVTGRDRNLETFIREDNTVLFELVSDIHSEESATDASHQQTKVEMLPKGGKRLSKERPIISSAKVPPPSTQGKPHKTGGRLNAKPGKSERKGAK